MKRFRKKKKMKTIIFIVCLIILLVIASILIFLQIKENNKVKVSLFDNLSVEINSKVDLSLFIDNIENGEILDNDIEIDTSKLGSKDIEFKIKNKNEKEEKFSFQIKIIDTLKPTIDAKEEITTFVGKEVDLLEGVTVTDNSNETIKVEVKGQYDFNKVGEYKLSYVAKDSTGNECVSDFVLKVTSDPNNYTFTTSKGYNAKVVDGITYIDGILIVNKSYSIPSTFGNGLTKETMNAFNMMKADATTLGLNLYISSGYRSYYSQKSIYNNYVARDGKANADTYSARAGHSEHQTGLAFDLNSIDDSFTYTDEGKWVHDNCYRYGLILRYPKGKTNITGYIHESWHLRYVGVELATKLYNDGNWITLEEYFGVDSKYNY